MTLNPVTLVSRFLDRLRFPQLFVIFAALFVLDVMIPDPIPFFDEIMLALGTTLLAAFRKRRPSKGEPTAPKS